MTDIDTADHVLHQPSGEKWLVAFVRDNKLCACGWPLSLADLSDCELVYKATPNERLKLLQEMSTIPGDMRGEHARETLEHMARKLRTDGTKPAPTEALDEVARIDHDIGLWPAVDDALPEPVAYLYQHHETGRTIAFPADARSPQLRWHELPLFTADQLRAAIAAERERLSGKEGEAWHWLIADATKREDARVVDALKWFRGSWAGAIEDAKWQADRRAEVQAECAALREQLAQAQQDAERYQWIKCAEPGRAEFLLWNWDTLYDTLDDTIDAAIAEGKS